MIAALALLWRFFSLLLAGVISDVGTGIDSLVTQGRPTTNWGTARYLFTGGSGSTVDRSFVYFQLPFPRGATVISAKLRLYVWNGPWVGSTTFTVRRITAGWKESGAGSIVWNNQPGVSTDNVTLVVASGAATGDLIEIDVTTLLQSVAAGSLFHGFRIEANTAAYRVLYSSENTNSARRPRLYVEWTTPPAKPTDMKPSGGRSVSGATPTLSWTFVDSLGENQSKYQVQISTAADMSAIVYDSGWVVDDDWHIDLTGSGFAATDGSTYYWRVRVQDNYGLQSPWSDVQSFRRDTKGVLTITAPSSGSPVVHDLTPTISHTFTGRVQSVVEYFLSRQELDGAWTEIHNSGRRATSDLDYELPIGLIDDEGPYRIVLRVWDTITREETPSDPAYVEATRDFTYDCSGSPAGPTGLAVVNGGTTEGGGLVLTWHRGSAPDYFAIKVDGKYIEPRLDPADAAEGGGDYRWVLYRVRPRVSHVFEVQAVELTSGHLLHSCGDPEITMTPEPVGMWLVDPATGLSAVLLEENEPQLTVGESGTTFNPIGARAPVRKVDAIRGDEGTVSGSLMEYNGLTALAWKQRLEQLKGLPPDTEIRLIYGHDNIPVTLGVLSAPEIPSGGDYAVSLEVLQTGEFGVPVK